MRRPVVLVIAASIGLVGAVAVASAAKPAPPAKAAKVTICHKTDAGTFRRISVSAHAAANLSSQAGRSLRKDLRHTGDVIVVGDAPCPSASTTPSASSTPPPKILICHKTHSAHHPYARITVSSRSILNPMAHSGKLLRGHLRHAGDIFMPGGSSCPTGPTG
jgi:hypothetical protein